jgi:beta-galactosidase
MREKLLFDFNWKFHQGDLEVPFPSDKGPAYTRAKTERAKWGPACMHYNDHSDGYGSSELCTTHWETVRLPHDYIITQRPEGRNNPAHGFFKYENAWYRNRFNLEEEDRGKRITLFFEGVAVNATVYVNGCLLARNFCGYTSFEVDVSDVARFGEENVVAVYVDTREHEGWWYEGAGIYRHVWLIKTGPVSVDLWGVYVHPEKAAGNRWNTPVETTVRNDSTTGKKVKLSSAVTDRNGKTIAAVSGELAIGPKSKAVLLQVMEIENPALWDIESPNLYTLRTTVEQNGVELDRTETGFGFRTIKFDPNEGFFLNGRNVKIKGVCCHGDYGLTGKAVPDSVQRYRLELLKEMGANAFRTSHYPHSEVSMDAMDELGFLVMDETRWFDSSPEGLRQLEMLVKRDRNRPSVIFWSIGNEEPYQQTDMGRRISETMAAFVKSLDKTRPLTGAINRDPVHSPVHLVHDVIGVNYCLEEYDAVHKQYPDTPIVASEICATGTTRGWYQDDDPARAYITAYDHTMENFPAFKARELVWKTITARPWMMGEYQWAGIEHRGEAAWPRLCSQSGALDLFLFRKDAFYQNKSHWTEVPMIHLLPHWNLAGREGETLKVWAYTNCEEAELFQDGRSLGSRSLGSRTVEKYGHGEWLVPYSPGRLEVKGFIGGKEAAHDAVETTGAPAALALRREDSGILSANMEDTAVLTCYCVDARGRAVPDASPVVSFECGAPGEILGTGSDISDHTPVNSLVRKMRAGLCAAAVRVKLEPGILKVYARAEGLVPARIELEIKPGVRRDFVR